MVIIMYLILTNDFLRGRRKIQIDIVLTFFLFALITASFFVAGWKFGLGSIAVAFIGAMLTGSMAARTASRLLALSGGQVPGSYVGLPPKPLQLISQELARNANGRFSDQILNKSNKSANPIEALIDYCDHQSEIQKIMRDHGITRSRLKELYWQLVINGAGDWVCGHWVAASSIAYPASLRYLLKRQDQNIWETVQNLTMHFERGFSLE